MSDVKRFHIDASLAPFRTVTPEEDPTPSRGNPFVRALSSQFLPRLIYLDYLATTPLCGEAIEEMQQLLARGRAPEACWGNPASAHAFGVPAYAKLEEARLKIASMIACRPDEVTFESGSTESINHCIRGALAANPARKHMVTSTAEHPAVKQTVLSLGGEVHVTWVKVDAQGLVSPRAVAEAVIPGETCLVSVMLANNETGAVNHLAEVCRLVKARDSGVLVHTDASQAVGKIWVDVDVLGVDLLTIAAHKLYGPKGIGATFVRTGVQVKSINFGGGQEHGRRAGTENVLLAAAFGCACDAATKACLGSMQSTAALREDLRARLQATVAGVANGPAGDADRLPGALSISIEGVMGYALAQMAADKGLCFSAGAACHAQAAPKPSAVLMAMDGMTEARALSTIRLSIGRYTTKEEVAEVSCCVAHVGGRPRLPGWF
jgi:cysteine desulfurase